MDRSVRRFGIVAILALMAVLGRAQQAPQPGADGGGGVSRADAEAGPRVVIGGAPKAEAVPAATVAANPIVAPAAEGAHVANLNALIIEIIRTMPNGGGYATNAESFAA